MSPRGLVVVLLLIPMVVHAGRIVESNVDYAGEVYGLSVVAAINATPDQVMNALTNYRHLSRVNPDIIESEILLSYSPNRHRVRSLLKTCILIFCKRIRHVQDVTQISDRLLEAITLPEDSDFEYGIVRWELVPGESGVTHMHFDAQLKPAFWIPPVIGTWLVEKKLVREITTSTFMIEADAKVQKGAGE